MNKLIYIITSVLLLSCSSNDKNVEGTEHKHNFIRTFEGKIDNKYEIIAKLESKDNILTGKYMYKGQTGELNIKGQIMSNDSIQLNEYNNKGSLTGIFKGIFTNGKIEGEWKNPMGNKIFSFYFLESNTDYSEKLKSSISQKLDGTYRCFSNELTIKTISEDLIEIEVSIGSEVCEMGGSNAKFKKIGDNKFQGVFSDIHPTGKFTAEYKNNQIILTSNMPDSETYLGFHCFITGEYK